ncbi:hypothetical protein M0R04_07580 [Candidatus Dojkabacteria bacterium]|jgi:hypothetical protein|nr:hypothetical protein [Candidatus Dojkabacteria bacterium]
MLLNEIFNIPYKWTWNYKDSSHFEAVFLSDSGIKYSVKGAAVRAGCGQRWVIAFSQVDYKNNQDVYDITNTGDAYKVFGTVVEVLSAFIEEQSPSAITFVGKEANRMQLYKRMVRNMLPSWKISDEHGDMLTISRAE